MLFCKKNSDLEWFNDEIHNMSAGVHKKIYQIMRRQISCLLR